MFKNGEGAESRTLACSFGDRRATVTLHRHNGGGDRTRTRYLLNANQTLSLVSYTPIKY